MYNTILDICFPGVVVVVLYRSFLAPLLVNKYVPSTIQAMLTCPLCFGFHVSWMWLALRYLLNAVACNSLCERTSLLGWITIPLLGSLFSYILEHAVTLLTEAEQVLSILESRYNQSSMSRQSQQLQQPQQEVSEDTIVEERRRG